MKGMRNKISFFAFNEWMRRKPRPAQAKVFD